MGLLLLFENSGDSCAIVWALVLVTTLSFLSLSCGFPCFVHCEDVFPHFSQGIWGFGEYDKLCYYEARNDYTNNLEAIFLWKLFFV